MKHLMTGLFHPASFCTPARCSYTYSLQKENLTDCHYVNMMMEARILHTMNILIDLSHLLCLSVMSKGTNELFLGINENCNG